jgi:hypothetical protein
MKCLVFLALTGCSTAYTAEAPVQLDEVMPVVQETAEQLAAADPSSAWLLQVEPERMEDDPQYTVEVMERVTARISLMSHAERQPLSEAMSSLLGNCPYTRARVMVSLATDRELSAMDPSSMSEQGQVHFAELSRQARSEADFFRSLGGGTLPMPLPSDYLASAVRAVDGPTFAASQSPIILSLTAVSQVDEAVDAMPTEVQDSVQVAWDVLKPHMGNRVVMHFTERHYRDALTALIVSESADALPAGLTDVSAMVDELSTKGC